MWFYYQEATEIETLTCLETGTQVSRSGNVIDRPLEQDEMLISKSSGSAGFQSIVDALLTKGELAGYSGNET